MNPTDTLSDEEFGRHALAILQRELGVDGLARFLRVYRAGMGDYTRDRKKWLTDKSVQSVAQRIRNRKKNRS